MESTPTTTVSRYDFPKMYAIQSQHLLRWAKILKPEVYLLVAEEVCHRNAKGYNRPEDVCRGTDIDNIVSNIQYKG